MKSENKQAINIDRLFAVIGFLVALIALFLSWQANNISRQQITSQVVVLTTNNYGAILTNLGSATETTPLQMGFECFQDIRLTNLGGATTAVVAYEATIQFKESTINLSSEEAIAYTKDSFESRIGDFAIALLNEDGDQGYSPRFDDYAQKPYLLKFPAQIEAFKTIDINQRVRVMTKNSRVISVNFPSPGSSDYTDLQTNFDPLTVAYSLQLSSGQTVLTPPILCIYVSKQSQ